MRATKKKPAALPPPPERATMMDGYIAALDDIIRLGHFLGEIATELRDELESGWNLDLQLRVSERLREKLLGRERRAKERQP